VSALDRELDVLHVVEVRLEPILSLEQLGVCSGQPLLHLADFERRTDAGHDVLTLRVDEELAVEFPFAGRGVPRERDAGPGVITHVAEYHRHDVHAGAEILGDAVHLAVIHRLLERPGLPHGLDGAPQLLLGIHRKGRAGLRLHQCLVFLDEVAKRFLGEIRILLRSAHEALRAEQLLE
jgi:hypothetical protein